jgi:hypothetical protein
MKKGGIIIYDKKNKYLKDIKNITEDEALEDLENLKKKDPLDINNQKGIVGNKFLDYFFFEKRIKTRKKTHPTFPEFLEKIKMGEISEREKIWILNFFKSYKNKIGEKKSSNEILKILYRYFNLYHGSISSFKPIIAEIIYKKFNPKSILDFSAGWGGRFLGAYILDIPYIGFDTNKELKEPYENMTKILNSKKQKIIFKDSSKIDFSKYNYDMVFTSPPYYNLERYENMPIYKDKQEFNEKFLYPVIINSYKHMKKGHYILNIPKNMYEDIINNNILKKADEIIPLHISNRNIKKKELSESDYSENIYVWKKI